MSIDVSRPYLRQIPPFVGARVTADGMRLPFRSETFDRVLATEVLEHVLEPERLYERFVEF